MHSAARRFLLNAIILSTLTTTGTAQNQQGIYVGRPKVFDHRTLQLMLEDLNAQLAGLKSVDQASVNGKIGGLQGMEIRETGVAGSIGIRRPYTTRTTEDGKVTDAEVVPEVPAAPGHGLGDAVSVPMGDPAFNMSAQDVLSEQINLQYQIFNLRMITDRSLTDRIQGTGSKLQAVLGIPVSLDPSREALDSAAIVKVTVQMLKGGKDQATPPTTSPISVVALMPQEKTYNSATLNKSDKAFSGSAIAKIVQVGFTATKRGQTYFLYRDNDTISFEHPVTTKVLSKPSTADDKTVVFGWQFRPVLGRRSVAPGMRQMFAVIALPTPDEGINDATLQVTVETRWVKYQRSQLTVYPNTLWYENLGASIGKPRTPPQPDAAVTFQVAVPTTESYQTKLAPKITEVGWSMVGTKNAIVNVQGSNFLSDTKVIMGGKTYDTTNGIKIKSEKSFDLVIESEGIGDAVIQGRYGNSVPLLRPIAGTQQLRVEQVDWPPPIDGYSTATIYLSRPGGLTTKDLPHRAAAGGAADRLVPQLTMSGNVIVGPFTYQDVQLGEAKTNAVAVSVAVPADIAKQSDGTLTLSYPFHGGTWAASFNVRDRNKVYTATRLKAGVPTGWTFLAVTDKAGILDQTPDLRVVLPTNESILLAKHDTTECKKTDPAQFANALCWQDKMLAILRIKTDDLGEELLMTRNGIFFRMTVPPAEKKPETPKKNLQVNQYDSVWLSLEFHPSSVDAVMADGAEIVKRKNGERTDVLLTRKLTAKPGTIDLLVYSIGKNKKRDNGKVVRIEVICKECQAKEAGN